MEELLELLLVFQEDLQILMLQVQFGVMDVLGQPGESDMATIRVLPRIANLVAEGQTEDSNDNEGWQQWTNPEVPTFPEDPDDADMDDYININDVPPTMEKRTLTLTGNNSQVEAGSIDQNICIIDDSNEHIPPGSSN